ncbi:MAG TPA: ATP-binding cassette domain-containing protein [Planctomycetota bacterium]|nr:ATP-binding cassette domain-containing protein [Planctomycetota bacterium]
MFEDEKGPHDPVPEPPSPREGGAVAAPGQAIRIEDLHKSFGRREVLRGFSLGVERGDLVAIIGGSGSGKSVLLRHLAGLVRPDRGRVLLDGRDVAQATRAELASIHRTIGFLFQEGGLLASLSLFDNLALPLREEGSLGEEEIRSRVEDRLRRVGVAESSAKMPSELSGGMRKRAGLARAIIMDRSFLFLDEPTSALDPLTAASIRTLIREVHDQGGVTTLVVTHDLALARAVAGHVVFLQDGRVKQAGTYPELEGSSDPGVRDFFKAGRAPERPGS